MKRRKVSCHRVVDSARIRHKATLSSLGHQPSPRRFRAGELLRAPLPRKLSEERPCPHRRSQLGLRFRYFRGSPLRLPAEFPEIKATLFPALQHLAGSISSNVSNS